VDRIDDESIWLRSPYLADIFVGRETAEGLEATDKVIGGHEVAKMDSSNPT
jgi:hypothetical protein